MASFIWHFTKDQMRASNLINMGDKHFRNTQTYVIAKGNIIEGTEAKE